MKRLVQGIKKLRDLSKAKKEVASGTFRRYAYKGSWALCTAVRCRFWKGRCMLDFARKVVRGDYKVSEEEKAWVRKFLDEGTDGCPLDQI